MPDRRGHRGPAVRRPAIWEGGLREAVDDQDVRRARMLLVVGEQGHLADLRRDRQYGWAVASRYAAAWLDTAQTCDLQYCGCSLLLIAQAAARESRATTLIAWERPALSSACSQRAQSWGASEVAGEPSRDADSPSKARKLNMTSNDNSSSNPVMA